MGEIRCSICEGSWDIDDGDVEAAGSCWIVRRFVAAGGQCPCHLVTGHVLDVGFPGGQSLDPHHIDVEADNVEAGFHCAHCDRKPRITLSNDYQAICF